jgi:hypothetical protein
MNIESIKDAPNTENDKFQISISKRELDLLFKYLSRADLKVFEVPEINKIIEIFQPKNLKKNT